MSTDSDATDQSLQIRQDVKGDRDQVIGQAIDSTIVNFAGERQVINLTVYDRIPERIGQPRISVATLLTHQEDRQRKVLLHKVKEYWIKGVLEASLHTKALIELGLEERADAVQRPFRGIEEFPAATRQALPQGTNATMVFNQMGQMGEGRTLLVLGEPGAGKTILLLKLAQDLMIHSEQDLSQPIPVVFNLSSWARKIQTIETWLVQELLEKYQVSKALGKTWIEQENLILLLDGLDEVKAGHRKACVQALNQFMQTHGTTELVICCRVNDYQALAEQLLLRRAVCIQPLTAEQIDHYLKRAGTQLNVLNTMLQQNEALQQLATSPLMLSIMSLAYQGCAVGEVIQGGAEEDYRQHLFDAYIERMFQRRGTTQHYSNQQTQRWLIWLAQRMTTLAQTVFLIERLQPSWLPSRRQRIRYRFESSFISGLIFGLSSGLISGLSSKLFFELFFGLSSGLSFGLFFGLNFGLFYSLFSACLGDIHPVETLKWSWREAKRSFLIGLSIGLIGGVTGGLIGELIGGLIGGPTIGLIGKLAVGLSFGLIGGLIGGFRGSAIQHKGKPNQGIFQSARNAVILGTISGLIGGLIAGVINGLISGLSSGLISGLIGGLIAGGNACIRHVVLRFKLYQEGYSPWDYARFLDYATDRLFLQKVGGGYIFVHRMLLEHFAAMPLERGQR